MTKKSVPKFDLNTFSGPFRAESDRACAVLGAALLDAKLKELFNRRLQGAKDSLLSNSGAIGAFSTRIRLAYALSWFVEDVQFDLDQIRSIRNDFAHNFDHELSFSDPSIADRCRTLRVAQVLIDGNEYAASKPHRNLSAMAIRAMGEVFQSPRQRFEVTVEMLAQYIDELPSETPSYVGPNLRDQLWALTSSVNIKISATGHVGPAP